MLDLLSVVWTNSDNITIIQSGLNPSLAQLLKESVYEEIFLPQVVARDWQGRRKIQGSSTRLEFSESRG